MKEELLKGLTEEQIKKIKECKNTEEVLALAKEEGIELTDEQLEAISGGACTHSVTPGKTRWGVWTKCGQRGQYTWPRQEGDGNGDANLLKCFNCGNEFWY